MIEIEFIAFIIAMVGVPITACALIIRHLREVDDERAFQATKAHYLALSMIREQVSRQARVTCYNCGNEITGPAVTIDGLPYCKGCGRFSSDDPERLASLRLADLNEFRNALENANTNVRLPDAPGVSEKREAFAKMFGEKNAKEILGEVDKLHHPVTQSTPVNNDYCRYCGTWLDGKHSCSACGAPRGR